MLSTRGASRQGPAPRASVVSIKVRPTLGDGDRSPPIDGRPAPPGKETWVHVCVSVDPEQFLPRLKALAPLVGSHFPSSILQSVQLEISQDGRGVLRATNRDAAAEVEVPLLKVIRPGVVQLPAKPVTRPIGDVKTRSVDIEEILPDTRYTLWGMFDPYVRSEEVALNADDPRTS